MLAPRPNGLWLHAVPYSVFGLRLGRQLVVAQLPGGGLWIHSPIPWSAALRAEVGRLGEVGHVVGPNRFHDECLREFQAEYPAAQFHAAPGLAADRRDIRFVSEPLSDLAPPDWRGTIDQHLVRGMPRFNEVVFLHRPSRSLIIADLAFNFGPDAHWLVKLLFRLGGTWGRFTPSRLERIMMKDRAAVRASIDTILRWDFDRIVVGHGQNIETGGKEALRSAFAFL
ncbi:MAG TPA: hypothetical protein VHO24_06575 [Opitutaceae bacterium]|nr:hypothetical protein [Opitutaceae bacterium]